MDNKLWQRQMSLGEILSEGFRLIRVNLVPILLLVICVHAPLNFLRTVLSGDILVEKYGESSYFRIGLAIRWVDYLVELIVMIGIAYIVEKSLQGEFVRLGDVFKFSFSRLGNVFWTTLLGSLIASGLALLLIVPGIIWGNYYSFAITITALRSMSGKAALKYSKKLVQGQWWRVFGINIAINLLAAIFNLPILMLSRKVPDIKFLSMFVPFTIFNIVGAIVFVMGVVFFLNTEYVRDFQRENHRTK